MYPVRCFTCGKVLGNKQDLWEKLIGEGIEPIEIFKKMKLTRYCCKRIMLTTIDTTFYKLR